MMLRDWNRLLGFNEWESIVLLSWICLIALLTLVLIFKLLLRDWIQKSSIRYRLLCLSFISLLALAVTIVLNFGPFDYIGFMMLVAFQTGFMNAVIYTQIDILSYFGPISGISDRVIKWLKIVLIVLYVLTVPVFVGGILIHVYISGKSPNRARWIGFIIVPNVTFCLIFELWVEFYIAYILQRYLKSQSNQSHDQRRDFRQLQYWILLIAVHDVFSGIMFFMAADAFRFSRAAISVHFLLVAQIFRMMLKVTFPKTNAESLDETRVLTQSRLPMQSISVVEIQPGGACRFISFDENDTRVRALDFSSDHHTMDAPIRKLSPPPSEYPNPSTSFGFSTRLEIGLNIDTPTTSKL
jgi:hypothetical protein